jgi:hypothetical protein
MNDAPIHCCPVNLGGICWKANTGAGFEAFLGVVVCAKWIDQTARLH